MGSRRVLALVILGVLVTARPAHADWWDFIWEMSGPQMYGLGGGCEWSLSTKGEYRCTIPAQRLPRRLGTMDQKKDPLWVSAYSYYYWSTGKGEYFSGHVQGFGVDPMLSYAHYWGPVRVTHGAGVSIQRFWSSDFDAVSNFSYKIQPITGEWKWGSTRQKLSLNLRYFMDGFDTTTPPKLGKTEKSEGTIGFTFGVMF